MSDDAVAEYRIGFAALGDEFGVDRAARAMLVVAAMPDTTPYNALKRLRARLTSEEPNTAGNVAGRPADERADKPRGGGFGAPRSASDGPEEHAANCGRAPVSAACTDTRANPPPHFKH